ncbi:MAG: hypothetical protein B7X11_00055 [Acidobacteria bacterium 37-65-4]|nr:MAG: hypothetical protein B7X11_00055 [Acidobacteria bacterium 37-65-4]
MKKTIILALALALIGGGAAYANFCARDIVPAASLLVPYIVVDTVPGITGTPTPDQNGYTTLTVVTNVSSAKQLIHVTVYNAQSQGVVDFDEVLSGYDVWSINWRDLLTGAFYNFDTGDSETPWKDNGSGPQAGQPQLGDFWAGTVGEIGDPWGPSTNVLNSSFDPLKPPQDVDYTIPANTNCHMPWGDQSAYASTIVDGLQGAIGPWTDHDALCDQTGTTFNNLWLAGLSATNNQIFFYATIDTVKACGNLFPGADADYWDATIGNSSFPGYNTRNNVLTGYDIYLNFNQKFSESLPTVNLEAYGLYTGTGFYSKLRKAAAATNAQDDREPLGTAYAFNYFNSGGATTEVGVWKNYADFDTKNALVIACRPYLYYAWDENENSKARTSTYCPSGLCYGTVEPNVFPFETQKVAVNSTNFSGLLPGNGWMLIVFDPSIPISAKTNSNNNAGTQAYVFAKYNYGTYSTAVEATTMANYHCFGQTLPALNTYEGSTSTPVFQ